MLGWAIIFLLIAVVAAILGFGVLASTAKFIAILVFILFVILFVLSIIFRGGRGQHTV